MRVAEYPLAQIHHVIRQDPWVRSIFLAAGGQLDQLAERVLDVASFENTDSMMERSLALWERLLGIEPEAEATMEQRRADVRAMWLAALPPDLVAIQAVCDNWRSGGVIAGYEPGRVILELAAGCGYLFPEDWDVLIRHLARVRPAHLDYAYAAAPKTRPAMPVGYMAAFWLTPCICGRDAQPEPGLGATAGYPAAAAGTIEIHVTVREEEV